MKWHQIIFLIIGLFLGCKQSLIDHWEVATLSHQTWKYIVQSSQPDFTWKELSYNDSLWTTGTESIKDLDDSSIIARNESLFFRINFIVHDISKIEQAFLKMPYNAVFIASINGVEVTRKDPGVIQANPYKSEDEPDEIGIYNSYSSPIFFISKKKLSSCLNQGKNVLAVKILNKRVSLIDLSKTSLSLGINDNSNFYDNKTTPPSPHATFLSSNLPIVFINTNERAIIDELRIVVDMGIINNTQDRRNNIVDSFNHYNGKINIEIRGHTTQAFQKKSYSFTTLNSTGNKVNASLLGMPEENDWILYAPYADKSLMRNVLVCKLSKKMGRYASRTHYCELVINGNYQGIYVLMEKIKRDKYRVNIPKLTLNDTTGDQLTGGYIIRIDRTDKDFWKSPYPIDEEIALKASFIYHYPKPDNILDVQKNYIKNYITEFEAALHNINFNDSTEGYMNYIDAGSFIDFMIVNELSKNIDAYRLSTFMYKDRDGRGGKLTMGPLWDFNFSFGLADYLDGYKKEGWVYNSMRHIPFWWNSLLQDISFQEQVKKRWKELREGPLHTDTIMETIDSQASLLEESQKRNFTKWPALGADEFWPNYFLGKTYQEEVDYLKSWIVNRLVWLDAQWSDET